MRIFWWLSVLFLTAAYIKNGGFFGRQFRRWRDETAADRFLFLAAAMMAGCAAACLTYR